MLPWKPKPAWEAAAGASPGAGRSCPGTPIHGDRWGPQDGCRGTPRGWECPETPRWAVPTGSAEGLAEVAEGAGVAGHQCRCPTVPQTPKEGLTTFPLSASPGQGSWGCQGQAPTLLTLQGQGHGAS